MSDLINRSDMIEALLIGCEMLRRVLDDASIVGQDREKFSWGLGLIESFIDDVNELPSAESKIIRCKYCKNFRRWIDTDITFCDLTDGEVCEKDFCSRAERRTDE